MDFVNENNYKKKVKTKAKVFSNIWQDYEKEIRHKNISLFIAVFLITNQENKLLLHLEFKNQTKPLGN